MSDRSTKIGIVDETESPISSTNPFPTQVYDADGNIIDVQTPLDTDGDSVYSKDIKTSLNDIGTFETFVEEGGGTRTLVSGDLNTIVNNLDNGIQCATGDNPKWFKIFLERPLETNHVGIVAHTGDFSNVKISFLDRQGNLILDIDDSSNNTKYKQRRYPTISKGTCCILVEFYTADQVNVSFLRVPKDVTTTSRIKILKPDGTETEAQGTASGNFKMSLEELESGISSNSNSQLNVTQFKADGTEGAKVAGMSGAGVDGSRTLTVADTWYQVPSTIPTEDYILIATKESVAGTIRHGFGNSGTPSSTNGNKMNGDDLILNLKAGHALYVSSDNAGDIINWSTKIT